MAAPGSKAQLVCRCLSMWPKNLGVFKLVLPWVNEWHKFLSCAWFFVICETKHFGVSGFFLGAFGIVFGSKNVSIRCACVLVHASVLHMDALDDMLCVQTIVLHTGSWMGHKRHNWALKLHFLFSSPSSIRKQSPKVASITPTLSLSKMAKGDTEKSIRVRVAKEPLPWSAKHWTVGLPSPTHGITYLDSDHNSKQWYASRRFIFCRHYAKDRQTSLVSST